MKKLFSRVVIAEDREYLRFGYLDIGECDVKEPIPPTEPELGLAVHP